MCSSLAFAKKTGGYAQTWERGTLEDAFRPRGSGARGAPTPPSVHLGGGTEPKQEVLCILPFWNNCKVVCFNIA